VLVLDRNNYDSEVLVSKETILVDFWGPQCRPCLALMPIVGRLENDYAGKVKVGKVNAVENRMLCAKLRVMGLPTFLIYRGGTEIARLTGEQLTENDLIKAIDAALADTNAGTNKE
jgi:thioredoxin 1